MCEGNHEDSADDAPHEGNNKANGNVDISKQAKLSKYNMCCEKQIEQAMRQIIAETLMAAICANGPIGNIAHPGQDNISLALMLLLP